MRRSRSTSTRRTRSERAQRTRSQQRTWRFVVGAALIGVTAIAGAVAATLAGGGIAGAGGLLGMAGGEWSDANGRTVELGTLPPLDASTPGSAGAGLEHASDQAGSAESTAAASVEVPDLHGKSVAEARAVLEALGLAVGVPASLGEGDLVGAQEPRAATVVASGTVVMLASDAGALAAAMAASGTRDAAAGALAGAAPGAASSGRATGAGYVVVIDPGHQSRGDSTHEPIGPGASETKPRVTGGTSGVVTRIAEYEVVLQISTNLASRLEQAGVTVIMTRDTNDVSISNSERAAIANEANADLFVRVHADGSTNPDIAGISTLFPGENRWTTPISAPSSRAATLVQEATVAATGATSRGTIPRTDLSGFNWCRVPTVLVETGFMSNAVEDRLLSSPHYQDKLAEGMATGIIAFLMTEEL